MNDRLELLRFGLVDQQVCVPKGMTDAEIEAELGRQVATGLSGPANDWRVTKDDPVRVQCDEYPEREHVVLACGGFADVDRPMEKQFPDGDSESFR